MDDSKNSSLPSQTEAWDALTRVALNLSWSWDHSADRADAEALYAVLENEVIPEFYKRDEQGIPRSWVRASVRAWRR